MKANIETIAKEIAAKVNAQLALGRNPGTVPPALPDGKALFDFTTGGNADMLKVKPLFEAGDLAFSGDGAPGDTGNLKELLKIKNQDIVVGTLGTVQISDADTQIVGKLGVESQLNKSALKTTQTVRTQSIDDWQSTSGVNQDEEAVNLVEYQNMYQANLKVISIANQLFDATLAMMG